MPCLVALIVLAFLGVFSAKYRSFAKEAFDCVFRHVTLRPCQTNFNLKVKTTVSSWFLKRNEKIGGFVFRRFEILNWVFVLLFLVSGAFTARSAYFYFKYGSCTPQNPQNCVVNQLIPGGTTSSQTGFPPCEEYNAKSTTK